MWWTLEFLLKNFSSILNFEEKGDAVGMKQYFSILDAHSAQELGQMHNEMDENTLSMQV